MSMLSSVKRGPFIADVDGCLYKHPHATACATYGAAPRAQDMKRCDTYTVFLLIHRPTHAYTPRPYAPSRPVSPSHPSPLSPCLIRRYTALLPPPLPPKEDISFNMGSMVRRTRSRYKPTVLLSLQAIKPVRKENVNRRCHLYAGHSALQEIPSSS